MAGNRIGRINEEIRKELSALLRTVKDPRVSEGMLTITRVDIDIARPRDVAEVRVTPRFIELHNAIWADLREEVLKGYENQRNRVK